MEGRRFVGRAREIADLRAGLRAALGGRGQLFLVGGDAGIGKTRLVEQILGEAVSQGARSLWGRCWEASGAPAYWPWVQVVRALLRDGGADTLVGSLGPGGEHLARVVPELRASSGVAPAADPVPAPASTREADPEQERFLLFDAAAGLLRRAAQPAPLVIAIEDIHGADLPSLLLLRFVASSLRDSPVLLVVTYREVEARRAPHVARMLGELVGSARGISLRGLAEKDVAELVEAAIGRAPDPRTVGALLRTTGGNPFFLDELLQVLAAEGSLDRPEILESSGLSVPDRVRETIRRRIEPLAGDSSAAVTAASVLGDELELGLLGRITGLGAEVLLAAMGEAEAAGVVVRAAGRPGRYRFAHSLVRETIYGDLSPGHAVRLHRKAAEALEESGPEASGAHLSELAHHHFEAGLATGDVERAVHWCTRAGEHARAQLAFEEAARQLGRALQALELCGQADGQQACELMLALGEAQGCAGEREAASGTLRHAAAMARRLGDARAFARAALGVERQWFFAAVVGEVDAELVELLEEALDLLDDRESELRALVAARLAIELYFSPQRARCDELSREAAEIARRLGDPRTLATVLLARHAAIWSPDRTQEQLALADEALPLAQASGERDLVLAARWFRYLAWLDLGEIAAADAEFAALGRLADASRRPAWLWLHRASRATRLFMGGQLAEAEQAVVEALSIGERPQPRNATMAFGSQIALLRREQQRGAEVIAPLRDLAELYPRIAALRLAAAWAHVEGGDPEAGRVEIDRLRAAGFAAIPRDALWMAAMAVATECCWGLGDAATAAEIYPLLAPFAGRCAVGSLGVVVFGSASRSLGQLAALCRRFEDAERHFAAAIEENARMGCRTWRAHAEHEWAAMLVCRAEPGDVERARGLLESARRAGRELGLDLLLARIAALEAWTDAGAQEAPAGAGLVGAALGAPRAKARAATAGAMSSAEGGRAAAAGSLGPDAADPGGAEASHLFRREGEYWTIRYRGELCRLHHAKGLDYLATLLRHPGREFHVLELALPASDPAASAAESAVRAMGQELLDGQGLRSSGLGDAGEVLDARAQAAYKSRLRELDEQLADAEAAGDVERSTRVREEIDFLAQEVAGAVGLSGRSRRAGSPAERARLNVTRAVKSVVEKLGQSHPALGQHLTRTVRTGTFCWYAPDPEGGRGWTF